MLVFISSPYAGDIEENTKAAKKYSRYTVEQGYTPIAPHLLFPQFLSDSSPTERGLAISMGLEILDHCGELWCFGEPSPGMETEITYAHDNGIPVRYIEGGKYL